MSRQIQLISLMLIPTSSAATHDPQTPQDIIRGLGDACREGDGRNSSVISALLAPAAPIPTVPWNYAMTEGMPITDTNRSLKAALHLIHKESRITRQKTKKKGVVVKDSILPVTGGLMTCPSADLLCSIPD